MYQYVYDFWQFWFADAVNDTMILELLSVVSTIVIVYGVIILPVLKIFRGRKK